MGKGRRRGERRRWLWRAVLWSLFLTGCGQKNLEMETEMEMETVSVTESGLDSNSDSDSMYEAIITERQETQETEELTGEAMLKELLECEKFALCVWYSIDIEEEDTKETILQKMEQCEDLVLKDRYSEEEVFFLEDLCFFPNLKRLQIEFDLWDSRIEDFAPIAKLSQLKELYLSYPVEEIDLSFLGGMKSITELYLSHCQIADFRFLEKMPQLERLSFYYTLVEDLRILEKLPNLVELSLAGNTEADYIETVGKLTKMQDLGLQNCGIEDIGFLSGLTELRGVNLNENFITDLTPLADLSKLERLGAAINQICDIRPLSGLSNLFDLALDQNQIRDISALAGLSHLNQVGLSDNQIEDFSVLEGKEDLMWISVFGNPCRDFRTVWTVPLFFCGTNSELSEEQQAVVDDWMAVYRPEMEEYECVDYTEGDLNQDGLLDAAFVVNGWFNEGDGDRAYDNDRRLFILLRQADGSWKESEERIKVMDQFAGGMRGDPHLGLSMGDGYLIREYGWGSSMGFRGMEVYEYQNGTLKVIFGKGISDNWNTGEMEITITDKNKTDMQECYKIVTRENRIIRVYE